MLNTIIYLLLYILSLTKFNKVNNKNYLILTHTLAHLVITKTAYIALWKKYILSKKENAAFINKPVKSTFINRTGLFCI